MQGTVVHYDTLTRCGLLYDETGQPLYFRQEHLTNTGAVVAGQTVQVNQLPNNAFAIVQVNSPAVLNPKKLAVRQPVVAETTLQFYNWPGVFLATMSLGFLLAAGGKLGLDGGRSPRLIGSVFGMATAALLGWLANLFRVGARRGRVRGLFWSAVLGTFLAYASQSCSYDFQVDRAFTGYTYTLLALFFALYLLPYRQATP